MKKDIGYPNGVTIDMDDNRVYWCDAQRDIISSVDLNGNYQERVNVSHSSVVYPFGITTFRGNLYWTDWGKRAIMQAKVDGTDEKAVRKNYLSLMGIVVYHGDRQKGKLKYYFNVFVILTYKHTSSLSIVYNLMSLFHTNMS